MKSTRILNNYRVVYEPTHPSAMTCENWNGYVYEHISVITRDIGRALYADEVVHHLDGNRANNRVENLLLLSRSQHGRLHNWLNCGAPYTERVMESKINCINTSWTTVPSFCAICDKVVHGKAKKYCSTKCYGIGSRKTTRPNVGELLEELKTTSFLRLSKKYNVSDVALRKWLKKEGIDPKSIRSRSKNRLSKYVETDTAVAPVTDQVLV